MMSTTWIAALFALLVPGVALGANLRTNNEVAQQATSAAPPTRQRRLHRPHRSHDSDDSDQSGEGGILKASYVGCFRDNLESSVLDFGFISADTTIEGCMLHCVESGASFMGLKYGSQCSCGFGEEYEYTLNGSGTCTDECNGGGALSCGGLNAFVLFSL